VERGKYEAIVGPRGDGLSMAVELVASTILFGLFGAWLDGRIGTRPVFMAVLAALALGANVVKLYYGYAARMAEEQEGKPWGPRP
jgi:F0F1-type ATP synthase assembly protein I